MKENSEQPEFLIGAFVPVGISLLAVTCGLLYLVTGGVWRVIFAILTILLIAGAGAVFGAIWMSRR